MAKRSAGSELNHDNWEEEEAPEEAGNFKQADPAILKQRVFKSAKRRGPASSDSEGGPKPFSGFTGLVQKSKPTMGTPDFSFLSRPPQSGDSDSNETKGALPSFSFLNQSNGEKDKAQSSQGLNFNFPSKDSAAKSTSPLFPFLGSATLPTSQTNSSSAFKGFSFAKKSNETQMPGTQSSIFKTNGAGVHSAKAGDNDEDAEYLAQLKSLNESVSSWIKMHVDNDPYCLLTPVFRDYDNHLAEIESKKSSSVKRDSDATAGSPSKKAKVTSPAKSNEEPTSTMPTFNFCSGNSSSKSLFGNKDKIGKDATSSATSGSGDAKSSKPLSDTIFSGLPKQSAASTEAGSQNSVNSDKDSKQGFSFGLAQLPKPGNFTFGGSTGSTPFTFSNVTKPQTDEDKKEEDKDEDQPPVVDFTRVTEDDAVYSKKCKVFYKVDDEYKDRGIGMLYLKPVGEKYQLLVRADTTLGNILLNILLSAAIPVQRSGKNNVMIMCVPDPTKDTKPVSVLIRVKTAEDADELRDKLNELKN